MCRLYGWVSDQPLTLSEALGSDLPLLDQLSTIHEDGWGIAYKDDLENLRVEKDFARAVDSSLYQDVLNRVHTKAAIVHLRWATGNYQVCLENTHPFSSRELSFEHNGGFQYPELLEPLIDSDLLKTREGQTDSEWYFLYLQTLIRQTGSVEGAYRVLVPEMMTRCPFSSLNAMLLTAQHLYVISAHNPERRPEGVEPDYYQLQWVQSEHMAQAWSTGVRKATGMEIPNYSVLRISNSGKDFEISRID